MDETEPPYTRTLERDIRDTITSQLAELQNVQGYKWLQLDSSFLAEISNELNTILTILRRIH